LRESFTVVTLFVTLDTLLLLTVGGGVGFSMRWIA